MARTILAWKCSQEAIIKNDEKNSYNRIPHWDDLKEWNNKIASLLQELSFMQQQHHLNLNENDQLLQLLITQPATKWKELLQQQGKDDSDDDDDDDANLLVTRLLDLRNASIQARFHLKSMGQKAAPGGGIPIEPDSQTELANATADLPGVITALVPGAGGYDALCCLYINHPLVQQGIGQLWADWKVTADPESAAPSISTPSPTVVCPLSVQAVNYGHGVRVEEESPIGSTR